eukprot:TRINITY_DN102982_c0_g1_i1.p1 TRINITY_DN102982_c0_g1~~TRINITY_DN102982_c0_g1_i1.p1  ORF type:complete len:591 (+),score=132.84 TRINITY_DN102982_c0_g1_i1:133-1905(+)
MTWCRLKYGAEEKRHSMPSHCVETGAIVAHSERRIRRAVRAAEILLLVAAVRNYWQMRYEQEHFTSFTGAPLQDVFQQTTRFHNHRGNVRNMNFFNEFVEAFEQGYEPEINSIRWAEGNLSKLGSVALLQSQEDLKIVLAAQNSARLQLDSSTDAVRSFQAARSNAMQDSVIDWAEDEQRWDDSLAAHAAPVVQAAEVVQDALGSLTEATAQLENATRFVMARSDRRVESATTLVSNLSQDAQERLDPAIAEASQPLAANKQILQATAEAKNLSIQLESLKREAVFNGGEFLDTLRNLRASEKTRVQEERFRTEWQDRRLAAEQTVQAIREAPGNFFAQVVGAVQDAMENTAETKLDELNKSALVQSQEDLSMLLAALHDASRKLNSTKEAVLQLQSARSHAMKSCVVDWADDEQTWDASLAACAAPVQAAAATARESMSSLEASMEQFHSGVQAAKARSESRVKRAAAVVIDLPPEVQKRFASKLVEAANPVTANEQFLSIVAQAKDISDQLTSLNRAATLDPGELLSNLRELRSAKALEEKLRNEEEERKVALALAEAAKEAEDRRTIGLSLAGTLVVAAAVFLTTRS